MTTILHKYTKAVLYSTTADNLREADLREADLREANLREANLREADLREANLREAECLTAVGKFLRICGSRHAIVCVDSETISVGCLRNTLAWWVKNYRVVGEQQGYSPSAIEEYGRHLEYAAEWLVRVNGGIANQTGHSDA